jgi:hypothetical protein
MPMAAANADGNKPVNPLLWIFQLTFGHCHHRHLSRLFTIKHRTYKVCFDCGREFDMPDPLSPIRSVASLPAPVKAAPHHAR